MHWRQGTALNTGSPCGHCLGSSLPAQALTVLLVGCQLLKQVCPVLLLLLHLRRRGVSLGLPLLQCCSRGTLTVRQLSQPRVRHLSPCRPDVHVSSYHALSSCQHAQDRHHCCQHSSVQRICAQSLRPGTTKRSSVAHQAGPGSATWLSHSHWQGCAPAASAPALHRHGRLMRQKHTHVTIKVQPSGGHRLILLTTVPRRLLLRVLLLPGSLCDYKVLDMPGAKGSPGSTAIWASPAGRCAEVVLGLTAPMKLTRVGSPDCLRSHALPSRQSGSFGRCQVKSAMAACCRTSKAA